MLATKIAVPLALIAFLAFFALVIWKVPRLDLIIVVGIGTVGALYDIWETNRRGLRARRAGTR